MVQKFRLKPPPLHEGVRYDPDRLDELKDFLGDEVWELGRPDWLDPKVLGFYAKSGVHYLVRPGDWVVRDGKGNFWACSPENVDRYFEPVPDSLWARVRRFLRL